MPEFFHERADVKTLIETLSGETKIFELFEEEFSHMNTMLLAPAPKFKDLVERLRENASRF